MNDDKLGSEERCASTSNRNFEHRQGAGGRTHLVSPVMAAAAAVTGSLADVRQLELWDVPTPPRDAATGADSSVHAELFAGATGEFSFTVTFHANLAHNLTRSP
jgi:hypothetical protein